MAEAVQCDDRSPGLVPQRDRLHGRDIQESREAHVRSGGQHSRPIAALQLQPGREHAKGDRYSRRGEGRRARIQGARQGRGAP